MLKLVFLAIVQQVVQFYFTMIDDPGINGVSYQTAFPRFFHGGSRQFPGSFICYKNYRVQVNGSKGVLTINNFYLPDSAAFKLE